MYMHKYVYIYIYIIMYNMGALSRTGASVRGNPSIHKDVTYIYIYIYMSLIFKEIRAEVACLRKWHALDPVILSYIGPRFCFVGF